MVFNSNSKAEISALSNFFLVTNLSFSMVFVVVDEELLLVLIDDLFFLTALVETMLEG
jgi:hypothetical protein